MMADTGAQKSWWQRFDDAAFGIVYGAITVLSILLALGGSSSAPFGTAAILFGSVLAITLAKAFAGLMEHALREHARIDRLSWAIAWHHSAPTLATANLPTLLFIVSGLGWISSETAVIASQFVCVALLAFIGARAGWVLDHRPLPTLLGATFSGGIGLALSALKYAIH